MVPPSPCITSLKKATRRGIARWFGGSTDQRCASPGHFRLMRSSPVSIMQFGSSMTTKRAKHPSPDPRDREPIDEAPETPADEPPPVPVQDPPVTQPKSPYTVTKQDIKA